MEIDYNLHKSNSTYFVDSDVGRLHLVVALCGEGMGKVRAELQREAALDITTEENMQGRNTRTRPAGGLSIALGGVSAHFRREIKPLQRFEIWTRVLAWDGKWLYLVQHFVQHGAVRPGKRLLQRENQSARAEGGWWGKEAVAYAASQAIMNPKIEGDNVANGRAFDGKDAEKVSETQAVEYATVTDSNLPSDVTASTDTPALANNVQGGATTTALPAAHPAIFATVIAKYVFKNGRRTVPPEKVLMASRLLPSKPESDENEQAAVTPSSLPNGIANGQATEEVSLSPANGRETYEAIEEQRTTWDWSRIEKERARGMQIAELYSKLDALHHEFPGEGAAVLGHY